MSDPIREIIADHWRQFNCERDDIDADVELFLETLKIKGYTIVHENNVNQWPDEPAEMNRGD